MATRHPPAEDGPQPLEPTDLADFKVSPDRLDEALAVLKQVLKENQNNVNNTGPI